MCAVVTFPFSRFYFRPIIPWILGFLFREFLLREFLFPGFLGCPVCHSAFQLLQYQNLKNISKCYEIYTDVSTLQQRFVEQIVEEKKKSMRLKHHKKEKLCYTCVRLRGFQLDLRRRFFRISLSYGCVRSATGNIEL